MAITLCISSASGFNTRATLKTGGLNFRSAQFGTLGTSASDSRYSQGQLDQINHDNIYKRSFAISGTIPAAGNENNIALIGTLDSCTIINRGAVPFYVNHNNSVRSEEGYVGSGCFTIASGESITINSLTYALSIISDSNTATDGYYEIFGPTYFNKDLM